MIPLPAQHKKTGGQQEEGHGVVHHVQEEHHQTKACYKHHRNASIQDGQI